MNSLRAAALFILAALSAFAAKTTVVGTFVGPGGDPVNGQIFITANSGWTNVDGSTTLKNSTLRGQITNGVLSIQLEPNDVSSPSGTTYSVRYSFAGNIEIWFVPTSGTPLTVDDVRTLPAPPSIPGVVTSFKGRVNAVVPQAGDYTTSLVAEGSNLYFTNARARSALSATSPIVFNSSTGVISCPSCGTGSGGITGPGTTTNGYVPQWNGTGGAALGAGFPVSTSAGANTIVQAFGDGHIDSNWLPVTISANTTGNAATATALAATPSSCGSGRYSIGISASGDANCAAPYEADVTGTSISVLGSVHGQGLHPILTVWLSNIWVPVTYSSNLSGDISATGLTTNTYHIKISAL